MTRPTSSEAIEKATGKTWDEWLEFFQSIGAQDLSHKEIAQKVHQNGTPGWWAQNVTVAYEQHIGRRKPGQDNKGAFMINVSRTIEASTDQAQKAWLKLVKDKKALAGVTISHAKAPQS